MFQFLKNQLSKIYSHVTSKLQGLFSKKEVNEELLQDLERILLEADTGVQTTRKIIEHIRQQVKNDKIKEGSDLKDALKKELFHILELTPFDDNQAQVILLVGVNGTGKTTFASKLAYFYKNQQKKVLLAAADTFRAAATQQLKVWADRTNTNCVIGNENADPASIVYTAADTFNNGEYDILIIDTAGRLQNKTNLMRELEKIRKVLGKVLPEKKIITLLTIDSMLGQNSFDQAKFFNEATKVDGIVLTKMDGTGKGGIVFAISHEIKIPIAYISFGEHMTDMSRFDKESYVTELLDK